MSTPILATKLYIPPLQPNIVSRPRLIEMLDEGLKHKLTLISAPAGFGKTTLVSEWLSDCKLPAAWLSLDEGDSDPRRFLAYIVSALQTIAPNIGSGVLSALQAPQNTPVGSLLTMLLNDITTIPQNFILVLDDYHSIDSKQIDSALEYFIEHLPSQIHLVIMTREDPQFPLSRLRTRGYLYELRAKDLQFSYSESTGFFKKIMGLDLSTEDIYALETRTEGWIAGLQLAAISMKGVEDVSGFIKSFTGSHRFIMDYLVEEVLQHQSANIQNFLLYTSILNRICGPLCDAVIGDSSFSGQDIILYLEHSNLFIIPLDNERRWYRYHHLFAELLKQRLHEYLSFGDKGISNNELHIRASIWFEKNGFEVEAFQHAASANDIKRAAKLIEGNGMPLHFRGIVSPVLNWLKTLSKESLNSIPVLWTSFASVLLVTGETAFVEEKLLGAEKAVQGLEQNDEIRDVIGRISAIRSTMAAGLYKVDEVIVHSKRALEYLHPNNLSFRTFTIWKLGFAYHMQGNRQAAKKEYTEAISISRKSGNTVTAIVSLIGLGILLEFDNQLQKAKDMYMEAIQISGELPIAWEAHFGLAHIFYEWNELEQAKFYIDISAKLTQPTDGTDRAFTVRMFLALIKIAQGDLASVSSLLTASPEEISKFNFIYHILEITHQQIRILLEQGNISAAAEMAETSKNTICKARVLIAQDKSASAISMLKSARKKMEEINWKRELLDTIILLAIAEEVNGESEKAFELLKEALEIAMPGGFIRVFLDEGPIMQNLLEEVYSKGIFPDYTGKLLQAFKKESEQKQIKRQSSLSIDPLSDREIEILRLIALGFSNQEISEKLFLALSTVKGHNQKIFDKLNVQRRTEAVARARELGLL